MVEQKKKKILYPGSREERRKDRRDPERKEDKIQEKRREQKGKDKSGEPSSPTNETGWNENKKKLSSFGWWLQPPL